MQVFIFQSEKDTDVSAFTSEKDGANLPAEFAPWKPRGTSVIQTGKSLIGVVGGTDVVMGGIEKDGYCLLRTAINIERRVVPSMVKRRS